MLILMVEDCISSLDFDPLGTSAASIDGLGVCLISDVNTNNYNYHMNLGTKLGNLFEYQETQNEPATIQTDNIQLNIFKIIILLIFFSI